MLASSNHMEDIIKLNTIFAGSPFYYDTTNHKFEAKEGDYLIEGFEDSCEDEELVKKATKCFEYFQQGQLQEVYSSDFAHVSLETKLDNGLGANAQLYSFEKLLEKDKIVSTIPEVINEIEKIANQNSTSTISTLYSTNYLYHDEQWYVGVYSSDFGDKIYIPAIIAALNFVEFKDNHRQYVFSDAYSYIEQNPTEKDFNMLKELFKYNLENNIEMTQTGWSYIQEWMEKMQLEETLNQSSFDRNKKIKV